MFGQGFGMFGDSFGLIWLIARCFFSVVRDGWDMTISQFGERRQRIADRKVNHVQWEKWFAWTQQLGMCHIGYLEKFRDDSFSESTGLKCAAPSILIHSRNVQLIFARATCIKRAQKRVVYEGANVSGELEYDEFLAALQEWIFDNWAKKMVL